VTKAEAAAPSGIDLESTRIALVAGRLNRRMLQGGQGLSHGLLSALASVVKTGPLRLGALARREGISPAVVTRIVAALEKRGLVSREIDPEDRRGFLVEATAEGVDLLLRARSARAEVIAELLPRLSPADRAQIVDSLGAWERLAELER